jgi:hypothetical protein
MSDYVSAQSGLSYLCVRDPDSQQLCQETMAGKSIKIKARSETSEKMSINSIWASVLSETNIPIFVQG